MSDYSARLSERLAAVEAALRRKGGFPLCCNCLLAVTPNISIGTRCPQCGAAVVDGRVIESELRQALDWARSAEAWEAAGD